MNAYYKCTKWFYSIIVKIGANFRNAIQLDLIHNLLYKIIKIDIFLHFAVSNLDCVQIFNWYKLFTVTELL